MGVAVISIGLFVKAKPDQRTRFEEVVATLDEGTGALTNADAWMFSRTEERRPLTEQAEALGLAGGT